MGASAGPRYVIGGGGRPRRRAAAGAGTTVVHPCHHVSPGSSPLSCRARCNGDAYLAHAGMPSRRKLPLELGRGCKVLRRASGSERPAYPGYDELRDSGPGTGGSAVTASSRSCTTRMVESVTSLVTVSNAGWGGSILACDVGAAPWASLGWLESGRRMMPLFLSPESSDGTADRCGFHRPEPRLGWRGGRAIADDGDDSAHDSEADGERRAGY
jgi:hypothetical protein